MAAAAEREAGNNVIKAVSNSQLLGFQSDRSDEGIREAAGVAIMHSCCKNPRSEGDASVDLGQRPLLGEHQRRGDHNRTRWAECSFQYAKRSACMERPMHRQPGGKVVV